jgi:hypothetical protein
MLCDRLSHQGGLDGTVTTAQTTNLPTAALTRGDTTGKGVFAGLEIYTQIGTTGTTFLVTYTNQAGTGSQVSPLVTLGNTGFREANRFIPIPLASGDNGFRSVENVDLTATTGTAGAFGITLYRPLFPIFVAQQGGEEQLIDGLLSVAFLPEIPDDACLFLLACGNISGTGPTSMVFDFIED